MLKYIRPTNRILSQYIFVDKLRQQIFEFRLLGVVDVLDDMSQPSLRVNVVFGAGFKKSCRTWQSIAHHFRQLVVLSVKGDGLK